MTLFDRKKNDAYTIIIGCGRLGAHLANALSNKEEDVLIMDQSKDSFRRLSSSFGGLSIVGNGTDLDKLEEAHIQEASAVIAVTNDDNTNITVAQLARELYQVDRVIARLYDPERENVYH
ncbi:MAG: TrkA family potassium uptake protein, partial [Eubacteriales bacterium]|nr:TrkA family potassium uptake protein [Eubacteriales bacterium]